MSDSLTDVYLSPEMDQFLSDMPNAVLAKSIENSQLIGCSTYCADVLGFKHRNDAVGTFDHEVPHRAIAEHADKFLLSDREATSTGEKIELLEIIPGAQSPVWLNRKGLMRDRNGAVSMLLCTAVCIADGYLMTFGKSIWKLLSGEGRSSGNNLSVRIVEQVTPWKLTTRQSEILFYLLRGFSSKAIGEALGCSARTVESHIEHIKIRSACSTRAELLEKSLAMGFDHMVPKTLLKQMR